MVTCVICLEDINGNNKTLQCGHTFHKKCIKKWFKKNNTCPTCRNVHIIKQKKRKRMKKPFVCVMCYNITACVIAVASSPFIVMYAVYKELQDNTVRRRRGR